MNHGFVLFNHKFRFLISYFFLFQKVEPWEAEKEEDDWERFYWEKSQSKNNIVNYFKLIDPNLSEEQILQNETVKNYAQAVSRYIDQGENEETLENYKQKVLDLVFPEAK